LLATGYGYGTNLNWQTIYSGGSSTSMAAPQAAAAFALYRQRYSSETPDQVLKRFLDDANKVKVPDPRVNPIPIRGTIIATIAKTIVPNVAQKVKPETGRVDFSNFSASARHVTNVAYDHSPLAPGASVTPPLSCDYLTAVQDCTLREAVAAALPQDVISFL
jgi:subtilisin family serine protease